MLRKTFADLDAGKYEISFGQFNVSIDDLYMLGSSGRNLGEAEGVLADASGTYL